MKMASKLAVAALSATAMTVAVPSAGLAQGAGVRAAPDSAWYAGAALGRSKIKTPDDNDTARKIFGGYQINRNFAAEIGYINMGEASGNVGPVTVSFKSKVWELAGIGSYPLASTASVYAKAGFYRADTDAATSAGGSANKRNSGFIFGFGGQYDLNRNLSARLEWQRCNDVGGGDIDKTDVDAVSIGVLWKFR